MAASTTLLVRCGFSSIVLGGTVNVSDVRVIDNSFRDGVTLGEITVQQRGQSSGEYYFQRNNFRDLGGRGYFIHSEDTSRVTTTILDSEANNLGVQPETDVPGAGNTDSIIPYLTGQSQQRMLVRNFHYKNDKQVGGLSNTGLELFIYGMRSEEDRKNWCSGCRADVEIQDSVFERPSTDGIQLANYGDRSIVNLVIRRTKSHRRCAAPDRRRHFHHGAKGRKYREQADPARRRERDHWLESIRVR